MRLLDSDEAKRDLVVGIIIFIFGLIATPLINILIAKVKNRNNLFDFEWIPDKPIVNENSNIREIEEYPKNPLFDFKTNELVVVGGRVQNVQGFDSFKCSLIKLINTEKDKYKIYPNAYGVSYKYSEVTELSEFVKISQVNAQDVLRVFSEWIKEIHFIKRYKKGIKFK